MERKIYNAWAFTDNAGEKGAINRQIYEEDLRPKAKEIGSREPAKGDLEKYTCYKLVGIGYGHKKYEILSNPHNFSALELALICDEGNLCFGYRVEDNCIVINTD